MLLPSHRPLVNTDETPHRKEYDGVARSRLQAASGVSQVSELVEASAGRCRRHRENRGVADHSRVLS